MLPKARKSDGGIVSPNRARLCTSSDKPTAMKSGTDTTNPGQAKLCTGGADPISDTSSTSRIGPGHAMPRAGAGELGHANCLKSIGSSDCVRSGTGDGAPDHPNPQANELGPG